MRSSRESASSSSRSRCRGSSPCSSPARRAFAAATSTPSSTGWAAAASASIPAPSATLAAGAPDRLGAALENDLEPAALSLRPDLAGTLAQLRAAGALGAAVSGSGPTCFGVFAERAAAETAAAGIQGAIVSALRPS